MVLAVTLTASLLLIAAPPTAAASTSDDSVFKGRILDASTGGGGEDVNLSDYYDKLRGIAIALLLALTVCAGVLAATGKTQLALTTAIGSILLFGGAWVVIEIAKALQRV